MPHFDLAIIGSGSGNSLPGPEWEGRTVALIDSGAAFGGTCLNVGCIPTKMFVYPADLAAQTREAGRLGVDAAVSGVRWRDIRDRIFGRIDPIAASGEEYRRSGTPGLTLFREEAWFTGTHSLRTASGTEITAEQIVIAAGSRAVTPDFPGVELGAVHTSDTVMRIDDVPAKAVIIGGGYVAAEFAHIFSALGTDVTLVSRSGTLLKGHDADISQRFAAEAGKNWTMLSGYTVEAVEAAAGLSAARAAGPERGTGADPVTVRLKPTRAGAAGLALDAGLVLLATGRKSNADRLHAAAAGFDVTADGRLLADEFQRVLRGGEPVEGVWTLGDVSSIHQLKHVANHEARVVAHNLLHPQDLRAADHRFVPSAVFSRPQVASVGLTEAQARGRTTATGGRIATAVQDYGSTAYGWAMEDRTGFVKLVADAATGQLLGAHIMGHEASILIQPIIQAMSFGLDARTMARGQYWIHPALAEVVENALLALELD